MTTEKVIPVILSGGSGTRLWPLSRKAYPKQFLPLSDTGHTMLQDTALRVDDYAAPIIVANEDHRFIVAEQFLQIQNNDDRPDIILEPEGKNTAPAIALAAHAAVARDKDAIMVVLPADHLIINLESFKQALKRAVDLAAQDRLVTFGVVPAGPETGYGYIKASSKGAESANIEAFVEKPDLKTAQSYIDSGDYLWNSGMFVFKASVYLQTLEQFQTDMFAACQAAFDKAEKDLDFLRIDKEAFSRSPEDSIDYAVMEKVGNAAVVALDAGWSDIGSWTSLWEVSDKDSSGNVIHGDVIQQDCKNSLFFGDEHLITAIGIEDLVVVDTKDALLLAKKDTVQDVKKVVEKIKGTDRSEHLIHRQVFRPWGSYEGIGEGRRYQVKRIIVKPGERLSLQMHHHRAEHWIVVVGTAIVQRGEEEILVSENESIYIPLGEKHRLTNPGKLPLELIEVQSGEYLGEDDIVRFEDTYGRAK